MTGGIFSWALLALLALLALVAVVTDLRSRQIPNWLVLAVALTAPLFWLSSGVSLWPGAALQTGFAVIILLFFLLPYAIGMMGAGDVKLLAALALWFPWPLFVGLVIVMALAGGIVTLANLAWHRATARSGRPETPYGVAIAAGALWVIGKQYLYHFA